MKASEIKNSEMLFALGVSKAEVEIDSDEIRKAQWINVKDELPTEEGFYFILTDEAWSKGIGTYFMNEDTGKMEFEVWWATGGKEPKVEFWLKDHVEGLVYEQKKLRGDFGQ